MNGRRKVELGIMIAGIVTMAALFIPVTIIAATGGELGPFGWVEKRIEDVGLPIFIISQLFVFVVAGFGICEARESRSRKNVIKFNLLVNIFLVPTLLLLSVNNIAEGMINLITGAGLGIIRVSVCLWIYDKPKELQKKIILPVVGVLTALNFGLFVFNFFDLSINNWVFWVAQFQIISGTALGIALAFNAVYYKVFRFADRLGAAALNANVGNLLGLVRIIFDIITLIWFFISFRWLLKPYEKYEMTTWITGSPECQQKRLGVYKEAGKELPVSSNKIWKLDEAKQVELIKDREGK